MAYLPCTGIETDHLWNLYLGLPMATKISLQSWITSPNGMKHFLLLIKRFLLWQRCLCSNWYQDLVRSFRFIPTEECNFTSTVFKGLSQLLGVEMNPNYVFKYTFGWHRDLIEPSKQYFTFYFQEPARLGPEITCVLAGITVLSIRLPVIHHPKCYSIVNCVYLVFGRPRISKHGLKMIITLLGEDH